MKIYAISDLHLSFESDKPMDVFGEKWERYEEKILNNTNSVVGSDDLLFIAGDLSWAMQIEDTEKDFDYIKSLNGMKIVVRGNHDYWWKSISAVREQLEPRKIYALQNDSIKINDVIVAGTRGWVVPESGRKLGEQDQKIYDRELIRLKMALDDAKKKQSNGEDIIVLMHFPPFNSSLDENEFTSLLSGYGVKCCVYGHLHGKTKYTNFSPVINGVKYILSSCDKINFMPILIEY